MKKLMDVDKLISEISEKTKGMYFRRLPLPKDISKLTLLYLHIKINYKLLLYKGGNLMDLMYRIGEALIVDGPKLAYIDLLIGDKFSSFGQAFANGLSNL